MTSSRDVRRADRGRISSPNRLATYYVVQIAMPKDGNDIGTVLKPGMPAEALIKTSERTMASYLLKPLTDQMRRTFREK